MQLKAFAEFHTPALETDEVRHNLIIAMITSAAVDPTSALRTWTLGPPGACAVQTPGWPIILGELDQQHCHALAEHVHGSEFPGVVGPDDSAAWFAERSRNLGVMFAEPMPQQIHAISGAPCYPGAAGVARAVEAADAALLADWLTEFSREAVPHDPVPNREQLEKAAGEGRYWYWTVAGEPVAVAGITRRTRRAAAISGVYTPPRFRRQGYAGSVTAMLVERIYAEGKSCACLYTDLRNPYSNRCYAKIGFKPVCGSRLYLRSGGGGASSRHSSSLDGRGGQAVR